MKKIVILLTVIVSFTSYSQPIDYGGGTPSNVPSAPSYTPSQSNTLPSIEGESDRANILARAFEIAISNYGYNVRPVVTSMGGYGQDGTYSRAFIGQDYVERIQLSDRMVGLTRPLIEDRAELTVDEAEALLRKLCPSQYAAIQSWARKYVKELRRAEEAQRALSTPPPAHTTAQNNSGFTMYQHRQPTQVASSVEHKSYLDVPTITPNIGECSLAGVQEQYPELTELYLYTGDLDAFEPLKYQYGKYEYRRVKDCVTGKTWFGRNWGWIAGGVALATLGNLVAVNNWPDGDDGGGTKTPQIVAPHTEPHNGMMGSPATTKNSGGFVLSIGFQ